MAALTQTRDEAVEVVVGGRGRSRLVITCEHASERLPEPWQWPEQDRWLLGTHWASDLGAAELTRELAEHIGAVAVLSRFSRMLCDPNRSETDDTLFRSLADGRTVQLNAHLSAEERERRLAGYHRPFHATVDRVLRDARKGPLLFSVHTFTPMYEGNPRDVEIGVLFDDNERLAVDLAVALSDRSLAVWLNEPWSGKDGLIYSADRHAKAHGRAALELEVRQDLAVDPEWRKSFVPLLAEALADIRAL